METFVQGNFAATNAEDEDDDVVATEVDEVGRSACAVVCGAWPDARNKSGNGKAPGTLGGPAVIIGPNAKGFATMVRAPRGLLTRGSERGEPRKGEISGAAAGTGTCTPGTKPGI